MTANPDAIEHESDRHRDNVAGLIDELRTRLTAGEILDQVLGTTALRDMGGTLAAQAKRNPMALALAAGSLAWMMMSERNPRPAPVVVRTGDGADSFARTAQDAADAMKSGAQSAKDRMRSATAAAGDAASTAMDSAGRALDTATDQAAKASAYVQETAAAASDAMSGMADRAANYLRNSKPGASFDRLAREQPLLLAGIGFAAGMILGAGIPLSEIENELLGEQSDRLKDQARETVREGVARTKEAAGAAYDAAVESFSEESEDEETTLPESNYKPDGSHRQPLRH